MANRIYRDGLGVGSNRWVLGVIVLVVVVVIILGLIFNETIASFIESSIP